MNLHLTPINIHRDGCCSSLQEAVTTRKKNQTGRELTQVRDKKRQRAPASDQAAADKTLALSEDERAEIYDEGLQSVRKRWIKKMFNTQEELQGSFNTISTAMNKVIRQTVNGQIGRPIKQTTENFNRIKLVANLEYKSQRINDLSLIQRDINNSIDAAGISFARGAEPLVPPSTISNSSVTKYLITATPGKINQGFEFIGRRPEEWNRIAREAFNFTVSERATGLKLSSRVFQLSNVSKSRVLARVAQGMETGDSAGQIAKDLRRILEFKGKRGQGIYSKEAQNFVRLARTLNTSAYQRGFINTAKDSTWAKEIKWNLSLSHDFALRCVCQIELAVGGRGGKGIYPVGNVPGIPHPNCLCYWTVVIPNSLFRF